MKTYYLTDNEVFLIEDVMKKYNIKILTPNVFWYMLRTFIPGSRLQELADNKEKVYEEYKRNVWLDKINFR